jgi:putative Holliday junction resolvase
MARILSIDYGTKRTGLAVTDPQQIIATALETVETARLIPYLKTYFEKEAVGEVVIGMPKQLNNQDSAMGGMKKKDRQVKGQADKISAVLILQDYMQGKKN